MPSPSLPFLSASRLPNSCDRKNATEECRVRDSMTRAASLLCLAIVVSLLPIGAALAAVDRPKLERAFADWIEDDVWPEAKAAGVSRATFESAFDGVKLDWEMPELHPPGAPADTPRPEHQAEF